MQPLTPPPPRLPHPGPERAPERASEGGGDVAAFLRRDPGWLARHPELYALLDPPQRVHGERLADHMEAMLRRARAEASGLAARAAAASGFVGRAQAAVLALMRAADPAGCVAHAWPGLLGLDAASLCVEAHRPGARAVPPGTVAGVLGTRDALVRQGGAGPLLHGEAALLARTEALIRVPWHGQAPALLALACRDGRGLAGAGAGSLGFLGQALAAALDGPA